MMLKIAYYENLIYLFLIKINIFNLNNKISIKKYEILKIYILKIFTNYFIYSYNHIII